MDQLVLTVKSSSFDFEEQGIKAGKNITSQTDTQTNKYYINLLDNNIAKVAKVNSDSYLI